PVKKQGKPESGLRKLSAFSCQFPLLNPAGRDRTKNAGRGDLWHAQGAALGLVGEHLRTFLHQGVLVAVEIDEDGLDPPRAHLGRLRELNAAGFQFFITALAVAGGENPGRVFAHAIWEPRGEEEFHLGLLRRGNGEPAESIALLVHALLESEHLGEPGESLILIANGDGNGRDFVEWLHESPLTLIHDVLRERLGKTRPRQQSLTVAARQRWLKPLQGAR